MYTLVNHSSQAYDMAASNYPFASSSVNHKVPKEKHLVNICFLGGTEMRGFVQVRSTGMRLLDELNQAGNFIPFELEITNEFRMVNITNVLHILPLNLTKEI